MVERGGASIWDGEGCTQELLCALICTTGLATCLRSLKARGRTQ